MKSSVSSSLRSSARRESGRYVHQFKLALLELELTRRQQEHRSAARRVAEIEARLAELTASIAERQAALGLAAESNKEG